MTQDFKTVWKTLAKNKAIKPHHVIQYCLLKALRAKSNQKIEIAITLLQRAFTPVTNVNKRTFQRRRDYDVIGWYLWKAWYKQGVLDQPWEEMLTPEEVKVFADIYNQLHPKTYKEKYEINQYSYIFVRQDMKPEYQLVQASHVACMLGVSLPVHISPKNLYFVVIGVPDLAKLEEIRLFLQRHSMDIVDFREPDIGDEVSSLATLPIPSHRRRHMSRFELLRFG